MLVVLVVQEVTLAIQEMQVLLVNQEIQAIMVLVVVVAQVPMAAQQVAVDKADGLFSLNHLQTLQEITDQLV